MFLLDQVQVLFVKIKEGNERLRFLSWHLVNFPISQTQLSLSVSRLCILLCYSTLILSSILRWEKKTKK